MSAEGQPATAAQVAAAWDDPKLANTLYHDWEAGTSAVASRMKRLYRIPRRAALPDGLGEACISPPTRRLTSRAPFVLSRHAASSLGRRSWRLPGATCASRAGDRDPRPFRDGTDYRVDEWACSIHLRPAG
jgi:hypothetical protein